MGVYSERHQSHFCWKILPARRAWPMGLLLLAAALLPARAHAQVGDLLVAPTRVVFEGNVRTAELALVNIGTKTARYRISFTRLRMTENGQMQAVETPLPDERFADEIVRYTPREVVLEPRVSQLVRIQLRKPAGLAAGEYRSHLLFRAVPDEAPAAAPDAQTPPNGLSIKLTPIYGVSIPVIVRHGETAANATISEVKVQPGDGEKQPPAVSFRINRTGNRSVYGDLSVTLTPKGGKPQVIGKMNGVAVYVPNASRVVQMPLQLPPPQSLPAGQLTVTYRLKAEEGGGLLAEVTQAVL